MHKRLKEMKRLITCSYHIKHHDHEPISDKVEFGLSPPICEAARYSPNLFRKQISRVVSHPSFL